MPGMDGLAVCRAIRGDTSIAIIMLTVRNSEADKVQALDAGADDFVTKPFSTPELLARIRAALRRLPATPSSPARVRVGRLEIDFSARTVANGIMTTHLTPKELDLLRYLTQHANEAVSHRELLQAVWGPDYAAQVDYLRVFIKNLRKNRAESRQPTIHHDRALGWLSLQRNSRLFITSSCLFYNFLSP